MDINNDGLNDVQYSYEPTAPTTNYYSGADGTTVLWQLTPTKPDSSWTVSSIQNLHYPDFVRTVLTDVDGDGAAEAVITLSSVTTVATPWSHYETSFVIQVYNASTKALKWQTSILKMDGYTSPMVSVAKITSGTGQQIVYGTSGVGATANIYTNRTITAIQSPGPVPNPPTGFTCQALSAYSIKWNWNSAIYATGYRVFSSGNSNLSGDLTSSTLSWTEPGLSPNTNYTRYAQAFNTDGTANSASYSCATPDIPPNTPTSFTGVVLSSTSIKWTWTDNSNNESGFRVLSDAGSNISGDLSANTTYWIESNLSPNTSYSRFAQVYNSVSTANSGAATKYSFAVPPSSLTLNVISRTKVLSQWNSVNPSNTNYQLQRSTVSSFSVFTLYTTTASSVLDVGLSPNKTYYYRVRALNGDGVLTAFFPTGSPQQATTWALPNVISVAPSSGDNLSENTALTVTGSGFHVGDTIVLAKAGQSATAGTSISLLSPTQIHGNFSLLGLSTGSWNVLVKDPENLDSGSSGNGIFQVNYAVSNSTVAIGNTSAQIPVTITSLDNRIVLNVPANAIPNGFVYISVDPINNPIFASPSDIQAGNVSLPMGTMQVPNAATELVAFSNSTQVTGNLSSPVVLTLAYPDVNQDGIVDGTSIAETALRIVTLDIATKKWVDVPGYSIDTILNHIQANLAHFSLYTLVGPATSSVLQNAKAFPNPWRPGSNGSHDALGITFTNLTSEATIKIYNIIGELIATIPVTATDSGQKIWNGKNDNGKPTASGVYLAFIKSSTNDTQILKISIER